MTNDLNRFPGRIIDKNYQPGDPALIVTSPLLVWLMLIWIHDGDKKRTALAHEHVIGIMDAAHANPVRGVLLGLVEAVGPEDMFDLKTAQVAFSKQEPLLLTDGAVKAAMGEPLQAHAAMPAVPLGLDGGGLDSILASTMGVPEKNVVRDHPWFNEVGLTADEKGRLRLRLSEEGRLFVNLGVSDEPAEAAKTGKPSGTFCLVLADTPENRHTLLVDTFENFIDRTRRIREAQGRVYARYL